MAYPTGTGTELLYRGAIHNLSSTVTAFRWDGTSPTTGQVEYYVPANHVITVLSILFCEVADAAETIDLAINDGVNNINLLQDQALAAKSTFVWNDKFCLVGGDKMHVVLASSGNVDIWYTYIDQDWS